MVQCHIESCQNLYNISTYQKHNRNEVQQQNGTKASKTQDSYFKKVGFDSEHCKNPSELYYKGEM